MQPSFDKNILTTVTTYADESFSGVKSKDHTVVAQIPDNCDFNWFFSLYQKISRDIPEVKYKNLKPKWNYLGEDLKKTILSGISQALIVICDSNLYQHHFKEDVIVPAIGIPSNKWSEEFRRIIAQRIVEWANERMLLDNPLLRVSYHIEGFNIDAKKLASDLKSPNNVRMFVGRCIASYKELIDKESEEKIIKKMFESGERLKYFCKPSYIEAELIYSAHLDKRIFDEGNQVSVNKIMKIRKDLNTSLTKEYRFIIPKENGKIEELNSKNSPYIQAADLAAGFAREWYSTPEGIKKISSHFKYVVLNGKLIN